MISKEAQALHNAMRAESLAASAQAQDVLLADSRAYYDMQVASSASLPKDVTWIQAVLGGVNTISASAAREASGRVIVFLHGGGYSHGSADAYRNLTGHLASVVGCRVVSVDYRLAPEHPFPAGLSDAVTVYKELLHAGVQPGHIVVMGDSAGGGLALAVALKLRLDDLAQPAAVVAMSPWTDLAVSGESITQNAERDLRSTAEMLTSLRRDYIGPDGDPRDPLASPVYATYTGMCPVYIQVGAAEMLLDDSTRVLDAGRRDGVDIKLDVFPEMQHVFQMHAGHLPEADDAIAKIADYLRPRLGISERGATPSLSATTRPTRSRISG